jgi:glutaredoxin-like YruB-family protein
MDTDNQTPADGAAAKSVTIYSTPTCHFCHMAKDFMSKNEVEYTEKDVASDLEARQEMMDKSGQMGVPVIVVGEEMIVGFDEPRLSELLDIK